MKIFGNSGDGGRSRALMFGLPAVVVSVIGVILVCMAEFGVAKNLEDRYLYDAEQSNKEKWRLMGDLQRDLRMLQIAAPSDIEPGAELIPEDDPRRIELESNRGKEMVYLEKLVSLNAEEPDYKYKLALACLEREETRSRGLAIMRTIAPNDEPGHVKAHVYLAGYHLKSRTSSQSEAIRNVNLALGHAELCLRREKNNVEAMKVKARILYIQRKYPEAYEAFAELFKTEPGYFQALVDINRKLNREDRNTEVVTIAIELYDDVLRDRKNLTDSERLRVFQELAKCYVAKKDFQGIEERLKNEIELQSSNPDGTTKRVWAEHLLSNVYVNWLSLYPSQERANLVHRFALLEMAFNYNNKNQFVLRELTRMGGDSNEQLSAAAKGVYDPNELADAPALVLSELGARALGLGDYTTALRLFELARKKAPRSPEILNNLSFTYLVGDTPNPKRSLKLVDEALKYLPNTPENEKFRTHFHDTRGKALMQLGQVSAAVAEFEFALRARPNNVEVLESLIKCYRANDMDAGPYERHLSQVRGAEADGQGNFDSEE